MPNSIVEQARQLADRHAVAHRNRVQPDERLEARARASAPRPPTPPIGFGPVADDRP